MDGSVREGTAPCCSGKSVRGFGHHLGRADVVTAEAWAFCDGLLVSRDLEVQAIQHEVVSNFLFDVAFKDCSVNNFDRC